MRSGKPSSIARKPAEEMAASLDSRGSLGVPAGTVAKEVGILSREGRGIGLWRVLCMFLWKSEL